MTIVYIASSRVPSRSANSIQVMRMCQAFVQAGHAVTLLIPRFEREVPDPDEVFSFYGIRARFSIDRVPWLPFRGRNHLFGWLAARRARTLTPDLVYARHLAGCYYSARGGLDVVYEAHCPVSRSGFFADRYFVGVSRKPGFRGVIAISEALGAHLEEEYPTVRDSVHVAPDGADPASADMPAAWTATTGRLQVGYIGHLFPGKGMEVLSKLPPRCPWADFHIVGGSKGDILRWRARLAEVPNVRLHGFLPPSETEGYRKAFDVVLAPYQRQVLTEAGELDIGPWMSPLKIFEYMAAGKPIIASDLPVLREILNESNAMLVDPEDVEAWAWALDSLRSEPKRRALGDAARAEFESRYSWSRRVANILEACGIGAENHARTT